MSELRHVLAENVRQIRELRGWTQAEYADICGVSRPRISEIERATGSTSLDIIEKLARGAGVSVNALITEGDFLSVSTIAGMLPPDVANFLRDEAGLEYVKSGMKAKDFGITPEVLDQMLELARRMQMSKRGDA